jgi:predicted secreted acid phosphatase
MVDKKTVNTLMAIPEHKKAKDISEIKNGKKEKIKNGKKEKIKKEKKSKISLDKLRKVYTIVVGDDLPDFDDMSEDAERKKLIVAIKKDLK